MNNTNQCLETAFSGVFGPQAALPNRCALAAFLVLDDGPAVERWLETVPYTAAAFGAAELYLNSTSLWSDGERVCVLPQEEDEEEAAAGPEHHAACVLTLQQFLAVRSAFAAACAEADG